MSWRPAIVMERRRSDFFQQSPWPFIRVIEGGAKPADVCEDCCGKRRLSADGVTASAGRPAERRVFLTGDGVHLSTAEYAQLLARLTTGDPKADSSLRAAPLRNSKLASGNDSVKSERCSFPTGTLANHVAVRLLAGERRHVPVQKRVIFTVMKATVHKR